MITLGLIYLAVAVSGFLYTAFADDISRATQGVSRFEAPSVRWVPIGIRLMYAIVFPVLLVVILVIETHEVPDLLRNSWSIIVLGLRPSY